jgi:hypothetical protein
VVHIFKRTLSNFHADSVYPYVLYGIYYNILKWHPEQASGL